MTKKIWRIGYDDETYSEFNIFETDFKTVAAAVKFLDKFLKHNEFEYDTSYFIYDEMAIK